MGFTEILSIAGQLILSLSILVVLHECGHFFPAKWFKTKVEKFYLFFDPYFSLFKYKKGDTEYGIGWIPFGGYVKIAGMVDESMDMEQLKQEPQPWEFRSKKAWQRLIIMIGGVVVNFVLGIFLFAMILFTWGKTYVKTEDLKYGVSVDSLGTKMGLREGDKILKVGDLVMDKFNPGLIKTEIVLNSANVIQVDRNGEKVDVQIPGEISSTLSNEENKDFDIVGFRYPQQIEKVSSKSIAEKAGLKDGDKIIAINDNTNVVFAHDFVSALKSNKGKSISLKVLRGADTMKYATTLDSTGTLGIQLTDPYKFLKESREKYSIGQAIPAGLDESIGFLGNQIKAFGLMFKGKIKAKDNLGSVFSMAKLFDPSWNWERFWKITAMLSIILAFFNILPIPALDGGYVLFLLIELITGRKFSDKFMEKVTTVGFLLLMTLMIFALGLDITRMFK